MPRIQLQTSPIVDVHTRNALEELQNAVNSVETRLTGVFGQSRNQASPLPVKTVAIEGAVLSIAGPDLSERTGGIRLVNSTSISITRSGDWFTFAALAAGIDHGGLAGLTPDDDHPQYLLADGTRALTGDWGAGAFTITLDDPIPLVLTDTSPDIRFGIDTGGANRLTFVDINPTGTSMAVDFKNLNGTDETFSFVVQTGQVAFSASTNANMIFETTGTGDLVFRTGTGDISFDANAQMEVAGAAVWDYAANTTVVLGHTTGLNPVFTLTDDWLSLGVYAGTLTLGLPGTTGRGKLAYSFTGSVPTGNNDALEIEATTGRLFLNADPTPLTAPNSPGQIILNQDGLDVDTIISTVNLTNAFSTDADEDRVMVEGRDILRYALMAGA